MLYQDWKLSLSCPRNFSVICWRSFWEIQEVNNWGRSRHKIKGIKHKHILHHLIPEASGIVWTSEIYYIYRPEDKLGLFYFQSSLGGGVATLRITPAVFSAALPPTELYTIISDPAFNHESGNAIKLDCTERKPLPLPAWLIRWFMWKGAYAHSLHG